MSNLFNLNIDLKLAILKYLDNRSLAQLGQTCSYFSSLVKSMLSFNKADVKLIPHLIPKSLSVLNYRAGVSVGSTFYMPFINEQPVCFAYDLINETWSVHSLDLIDSSSLQPQITCATAIESKIYLVCGRLLNSYTLSNAIIEIDTSTFKMRTITDMKGTPPRPRHEHTVDAVAQRYLVVFGGLCYNSNGENDVFVYDILDNRWFVPPITGYVPHLRFGHASSVISNSIFIHGGAQLESDSSYIVYDDLYKLDCQTWTWYKYEHPEVERYLRSNPSYEHLLKEHLISTYGNSPPDRFQACMCAYGNKLVIFGGHSIREDELDNEILFSYSIDEISVFNTRHCTWSTLHADTKEDEEALTVSDMSAALFYTNPLHGRLFIVAAQKPAEVLRWKRYSSLSPQQNILPRILEYDHTSEFEDDEGEYHVDNQADVRGPSNLNHVRRLSKTLDNDLVEEDLKAKRRRPPLSVITDDPYSDSHGKQGSSSSHSSGSNVSLGKRKSRHHHIAVPCAISIDFIE